MKGKNVYINALARRSSIRRSMPRSPRTRRLAPVWQETMVGRWGKPSEIAQAALFLASDASVSSTARSDRGWGLDRGDGAPRRIATVGRHRNGDVANERMLALEYVHGDAVAAGRADLRAFTCPRRRSIHRAPRDDRPVGRAADPIKPDARSRSSREQLKVSLPVVNVPGATGNTGILKRSAGRSDGARSRCSPRTRST